MLMNVGNIGLVFFRFGFNLVFVRGDLLWILYFIRQGCFDHQN